MSLLTAFTEPQKLFAALKDQPHFAIPFWVLALGSSLVLLLYYQNVDFDWMVDRLLSTERLDPVEMDAARRSMNQQIMTWSSVLLAPIATALAILIEALIFWLAGKLAGVQYNFKAWFAFSTWVSSPLILSTVVALLNVISMPARTLPDTLYLTHLDPLLISLPLESNWRGLSTSVDLLSLWGIALGAIGWRSWVGGGWAQSIVIASMPTLSVYGIWAAFILVKQ